jgi:hypothetical protein
METLTELCEPDVYSRNGDTVTLTMSAEEFQSLIDVICLSVRSFQSAGDHHMMLTAIAVNNFIQRGNKEFLPVTKD